MERTTTPTLFISYDVLMSHPDEVTENRIPGYENADIVVPEQSIDALCLARATMQASPKTRKISQTLGFLSNEDQIATAQIQIASLNTPPHNDISAPLTPEDCMGSVLSYIAENYSNKKRLEAEFDGAPAKKEAFFVTNLPELAIKAHLRGVSTLSIPYVEEEEYTGISYVQLPSDLDEKFILDRFITPSELWCALDGQLSLVANQYFIFYPPNDKYDSGLIPANDPRIEAQHWDVEDYRVRIGYYNEREQKIKACDINPRAALPLNNPEYAAYTHALSNPAIDCVIVTGPAGTGKSYAAFEKADEDLHGGLYLRGVVVKEGKNVLGAVKGDVEDKMAPIIEFAKDSLRSIVLNSNKMRAKRETERKHGVADEFSEAQPTTVAQQVDNIVELTWSRFFIAVPYEYARGRTFEEEFIIMDEFQRVTIDEADTLLTRQGRKSKLIVIGDTDQITNATEAKRLVNGLTYARELYKGAPNVAQVQLRVGLRHSAVSYAIKRRASVRYSLGLPD